MNKHRIDPGTKIDLSEIDPDDTPLADKKSEAKKESEKLVDRLRELQELLFAERRRKVLVVLQGMDTSGKDGTVRHVMSGFNPAGVRVVSFRKPSPDELAHDYLWRVHAQTPSAGEVAVFNRSHYEDVLVVRVHELVPEKQWRERYQQINDFERMLVENDTIVLKFFLHISADEQRKRLQERIDDPTKRWKFQHGDLDERKLWKDYMKAYEDAIEKTSTAWAPWYVVPANAKWYRNYVVARTIAETLDSLDMSYPKIDLGDVKVE
ncbi:MAG: polyphosphate kinase 2 family protein [Acidobacteria bacterium]|nr:polyphosphate kinase 2 family protein [Acidobacteriota bacterium]MBV9478880.1 polyphosphate kinase 2 family protein [Acidobacteriota bacterium]